MHWTRYLEDPALADFAAHHRGRARVLVRRGYEEWVERLGLTGAAAAAGETVGGGRQPHPLVDLGGGEKVLVRRYLRGGVVRHLNRSRYFGGHRAIDELRATERARAAGVSAPVGIAAAEVRHAVGYSAWLATRWIPDALDLNACLLAGSTREVEGVLYEAGRQIGRLHAAGIAHPDLNLRNLLVAPAGAAGAPAVYLLDFDRARLYPGAVPGRRRARDLARLARSWRKLRAEISPAAWRALRSGYGESWPLSPVLG